MKTPDTKPLNFQSLSEAARHFGLPEPQHPLVCMLGAESARIVETVYPQSHVLNFYKISYKPRLSGRVRYGQHYYDFDEGGLLFASPGQIIGSSEEHGGVCSSYTLLVHPDFLMGYPLSRNIRQYGFFSYSANEALHLSDKEKETIISIFKNIEEELNSRIDEFSQDVILAQLELLLNYANRFYKRQFITRKKLNNDLLQNLEEILDDHFNNDRSVNSGIPTVQYLASRLNISPSYLSDMLRSLTGQNAQQHIHSKLIEKAKEKLSTTKMTVSEIAYELGFEHPQSFNKLFKAKTTLSPLAFRQSFN